MLKTILPIMLLAVPAAAQVNFEDLSVGAAEIKAAAVSDGAVITPARAEKEKLKIGTLSKAQRLEYIKKAELWRPESELNIGAIDFKRGPYEKMKYVPDELVTCHYVPMKEAYETGRPNGMSSKFKCRGADGKDFKVKYGGAGDVMAEVASSWLLTAIGSYGDKMYPVRLNCPDCPSDPFKSEKDPGAWTQGQMVAIEEKLGERMESEPNSGIGFDEFYLIEDKVGAEALSGMIQFLSNSDNKAENQAIACQKKDVVAGPDGKAVCNRPVAYLQDMGISFGGRGWYHNSRMNFDKWARERIWDDPRECVMHLNATHTSSLSGVDPIGRDMHQIGEQARQLMIARLSLLSRRQLEDIFNAARAPQRAPEHSAGEWADLFLSKVDALRRPLGDKTPENFRCPFDTVPTNSYVPPPDPLYN